MNSWPSNLANLKKGVKNQYPALAYKCAAKTTESNETAEVFAVGTNLSILHDEPASSGHCGNKWPTGDKKLYECEQEKGTKK